MKRFIVVLSLGVLISLVTVLDIQAAQCVGSCKVSRVGKKDERPVAFSRRMSTGRTAIMVRPNNNLAAENNGDEKNVPDFASQFSKTLEHDSVTGILTTEGQENYRKMLKAVETEKQSCFNSIVRAPGAVRKLVNPQAAFTFSNVGSDSCLYKIKEFPHLSSDTLACYMIENYVMNLALDVSFDEYGTGVGTDNDGHGKSITRTIAHILQDLGPAYEGARNKNGKITPHELFRGIFKSDLIGPYISQFLIVPLKLPINAVPGYNVSDLNQELFERDQIRPIGSKREYGISFDDFVAIQNGQIPQQYQRNDFKGRRLIINGRDMANAVHVDSPYEAFITRLTF